MSESIGIPSDLKSCQELIVSQQKMIDDLQLEQEKLRKLLAQMINGNRSEKRIFSGPDQEACCPLKAKKSSSRSSGSGGRSRDDH